jgi:hypothetical protein
MARCGGNGGCTCLILPGHGAAVSGSGTYGDPYIITNEAGGVLTVLDTATLDLSLSGDGSTLTPYALSGDVHMGLNQLSNVSPATPTTGQVLGWNGSAWVPVAPATAAPGAIHVSGCLVGDGSTITPLNLLVDPSGGLACGGSGLTLSDTTKTQLVGAFNTDADRNAYFPAPVVGQRAFISGRGTNTVYINGQWADTPFVSAAANSTWNNGVATQSIPGADQTFRLAPNLTHSYTAPAWAQSVIVRGVVQDIESNAGDNFARLIGRLHVQRAVGGDVHNPGYGTLDGIFVSVTRASAIGATGMWEDAFAIHGITPGEVIILKPQGRAASATGNGDIIYPGSGCQFHSQVTWSSAA